MAYDEQTWVNGESQANAQRFNHMEAGIKNAYNVSLIAITNIQPSECNEGDKYFNTTDNLIYTATDTDTWSATGETPISDKTYVLTTDGSTYTYNGTTLTQIGGKQINGETPIGGSQDYWGTTDPNENWLIMDGRALSRTNYAELFAVIGTTYGAGDGSTTFNIPNVSGRTTVALDENDTDFGTLGRTLGSKAMEKHRHGIEYSTNGGSTWADGALGRQGSYTADYYIGTTGNSIQGFATWQARIKETGTGDSGNIQPSIVCNKIIRVK